MKVKYIIAAFLAALIALFGFGSTYASADITAYTGVLEDLRADENFDETEYPQIENDYSVKIIQIAESSERELFVYVYQPAAKLHFTFIDISTDGKKWYNYRLGLINTSGVFSKYRVKGFTVSTAPERYYDISNILRSYNSDIDDPPAEGQSVSEVGCKVAQGWTATTADDGSVTYTVIDTKVVEIKAKVVGYCEYENGVNMGWDVAKGYTKAYFVAFSTDYPIDKLISADVSFTASEMKYYLCGNEEKHSHGFLYGYHDFIIKDYGTGIYDKAGDVVETELLGEKVPIRIEKLPPLTIKYSEKFSTPGGGWANPITPASTYTWNRIRSTKKFIADNNNKEYKLTSEKELANTQWVLNFYETQDKIKVNNAWASFIPGVTNISGVGDCEVKDSYVSSVQILRLEFETDGERYNVGVVDGRQTSDKKFNEYVGKKTPWWVWLIVGAIICGVLGGVICKIFKPFSKLANRRAERQAKQNPKPKRKKTKSKVKRQ